LCVRNWWHDALKPGTAPGQVFFYRLMSVLGATMLALTAIITVAAVRRWVQILRSPAAPALGSVPIAAADLE
jgi:hypothetical protein